MPDESKAPPVAKVTGLNFSYENGTDLVLRDIHLELHERERHILVGANGSGKTTLLRILAGKHMIQQETVLLWGRPAFHDTALSARISYAGGSFRCFVDITVAEMLNRRRDADPDRKNRLVSLLKVDPDWHMHRVSAGQRRRVQLLMELLYAKPLLLLDEATSDLDIVVRSDLLEFLREETELRNACVFYATHVFDGLEDWATHLSALENGKLERSKPLETIRELGDLKRMGISSPLYKLVEQWIRYGMGSH